MVSPLVQAMTFQNSVNPAQTGIAPTDVVGAYKLASDVAEKNYQAQIAAQNAKFGGLAGLGGAGITAFGPSAAKSLFGSGASTGAGVVGPTAGDTFTAGAADAAGAGAADAAAPLASGASLWNAFPFASLAGDAGGAGGLGSALGFAGDAGSLGGLSLMADAIPAAGAAEGGAVAAAGMPEWLAAMLPFLLA